jgi:hypothetical protein
MMAITGGCLCGAVRFRTDARPVTARVCWCATCQKLAAGNGTANLMLPTEGLVIEGELSDYVSIADSGNVMHRRFCRTCGTPLFTGSEARPDRIGIRAGALDDPELARPTAVIWTKSAPSWACWDETLPQFEGQPPPVR